MSKPKLHLSRLNRPEVINLGTEIKNAMTANAATFPNPVPTMTALGTMITDAQTALTAYLAAQQAAHLALTTLEAKMDILRGGLTQEASYVGAIASGNAATIQLAGMSPTAPPAPAGPPGQVSNVSVVAGDNDGTLGVQWDSDPNAASYELQTSLEPVTSTSWVSQTPVTKAKSLLTGYTSGTRVHVRIRAIGTGGTGAWSADVSKIVP